MNGHASAVPLRETRAAYGLFDVPLRVHHQLLTEAVATHWHEFYEIAFVLAGSGTHRTNGSAMPLRPGMVVALTPADFHDLEPERGGALELIDVIFPAELLDNDVQRLMFAASWPRQLSFALPIARSLEGDFRRLDEEEVRPRPGSAAASRATLQRILIDVIRATSLTDLTPDARVDDGLRGALLYLHHRFRQPVSLADAAAQAHLSPHYFSERFRQLTGMPFVRYRQELRLQFARSLLAASDLPVTEICHAAGFNTLSHFERAFRARWDSAPRSVRDTLGNRAAL
jgi:AraC-like DNA-binding protein